MRTDLAERFKVDVSDAYQSRYNAAPAQLLPVILLYSKGVSFFYWGGSPHWIKNKSISEKLINVRAEQFHERPVLQKQLKRNRCIVPADGFYVWKRYGKKGYVPYRFTLKSKGLFAFPALWEEFENDEGEMLHTFSIITQINKTYSGMGDRFPVILRAEDEPLWLSGSSSQEELITMINQESNHQFEFFSVSNRVNRIEFDDKLLIMPAPAADQFGNLTLFD